MEHGDDAMYLVVGVRSIIFWMPSSDILELNGVLYVLGLTKNLFLILVIKNLGCITEFDD